MSKMHFPPVHGQDLRALEWAPGSTARRRQVLRAPRWSAHHQTLKPALHRPAPPGQGGRTRLPGETAQRGEMEVAGWAPDGGGAEPAGRAPTVPDAEGAAAAAAGLEAGAAADEQDVDNDEATADIFGSYRPQAVRRPQRTRQPCRPAVSDRRCRSGRRSSTGWLAPTPRCWWRPPRSPAARWPERTRPPRATRAPQIGHPARACPQALVHARTFAGHHLPGATQLPAAGNVPARLPAPHELPARRPPRGIPAGGRRRRGQGPAARSDHPRLVPPGPQA